MYVHEWHCIDATWNSCRCILCNWPCLLYNIQALAENDRFRLTQRPTCMVLWYIYLKVNQFHFLVAGTCPVLSSHYMRYTLMYWWRKWYIFNRINATSSRSTANAQESTHTVHAHSTYIILYYVYYIGHIIGICMRNIGHSDTHTIQYMHAAVYIQYACKPFPETISI